MLALIGLLLSEWIGKRLNAALGPMSLSVLLRHRFPSVQMDMAFEVPTPGVTVLFGPSGAGKSTIIAAAAGLLRPEECRIVVDGQVLADTASGVWLPPERRRMGLVFQDARLFPHMSVATNLRFGLRRARAGTGAVRRGGRTAGHRRAAGAPPAHAVGRRASARCDRPRAAGAAASAADG